MTIVTALVAFYIPTIVMCSLYYQVYLGLKNRKKYDLVLFLLVFKNFAQLYLRQTHGGSKHLFCFVLFLIERVTPFQQLM